jgi:protein-S-isoprenylcysteine O-methyltransferase Ste14
VLYRGTDDEMRTSPHGTNIHFHAIELPPIVERRLADLFLFCVTGTALGVLFLLTPTLGLVGWLYVLQHLMVLAIALTRPEPLMTDCSVPSNIAVGVAYVCPYAQVICLYWWPGKVAWPEGGLVLVTLAAVFSIVCLLTIGKRFGVRPALRGLVTHGSYRVVRHPLYLSYVLAHIGFNLQVWNVVTLLLTLLGWTAMVCRIRAEERVLSRDPGWPGYVGLVRYRLIPGLW